MSGRVVSGAPHSRRRTFRCAPGGRFGSGTCDTLYPSTCLQSHYHSFELQSQVLNTSDPARGECIPQPCSVSLPAKWPPPLRVDCPHGEVQMQEDSTVPAL